MKKKNVLILLIIVVLGFSLYFVFKRSPEPSITMSYTFEYGDEVILTSRDLSNNSDIDFISLDASTFIRDKNNKISINEYLVPIVYTYGGSERKEIVTVFIEDTTAPVITVRSNVKVIKDSKLRFEDYFKVSDLSPYTVTVDDKNFDVSTLGKYEILLTATDKYNNKTTETLVIEVVEAKDAESNTGVEATYVNGILIVNKKYALPKSYAKGEDPRALGQFRRLVSDMQASNYDISDSYSGYRSYERQETLYKDYVKKDGKEKADTYSARPGHSEHQSGFTFDIKHKDGTLVTRSPELEYVQENAHRYGFIVRYPEGKEAITGYMYEPWHLRYVGDVAEEIYNQGLTLEEYLDIEGGGYSN